MSTSSHTREREIDTPHVLITYRLFHECGRWDGGSIPEVKQTETFAQHKFLMSEYHGDLQNADGGLNMLYEYEIWTWTSTLGMVEVVPRFDIACSACSIAWSLLFRVVGGMQVAREGIRMSPLMLDLGSN